MEKFYFIYTKDLTLHETTTENKKGINNNKNCLENFGFFILIFILWVA